MKTGSQLPGLLLMGIVILCSMGCRKLSERPEYSLDSQERINSWVLDSMKVYYYWNTSVPDYINFTGDPSDFFNILKNPSDRFSALVNPDLPQTYPPSLVHILGFDLITFESTDGKVQTVITLVVPGSAAAARGLLRGDIVHTIDGIQPAAANITSLTERAIARQMVTLEIAGRDGSMAIGRLTVSEVPVYTYKVFQSGGKSYGYLFLNSFEDPAVDQLVQAFSYFKQQQVRELVLDLRYNPGGSIPVAAALATMIAPAAREGDTYVEYRGNAKAGIRNSSFAQELSRLPAGIKRSFSQFAGYRLGLSRVYILSGSHTASAAELTINALKPYLPVIQLGAKSLGKDMASFVIKDYRSPQLVPKWEIYPLVFKLYNAAGKGDYSGGLSPDQEADELSALPLKPFGDLTDPLLKRCLAVSGAATPAGVGTAPPLHAPKLLFDSRNRIDAGIRSISVSRN